MGARANTQNSKGFNGGSGGPRPRQRQGAPSQRWGSGASDELLWGSSPQWVDPLRLRKGSGHQPQSQVLRDVRARGAARRPVPSLCGVRAANPTQNQPPNPLFFQSCVHWRSRFFCLESTEGERRTDLPPNGALILHHWLSTVKCAIILNMIEPREKTTA